MEKRGQVTLFIILGIVILILVGLYVHLTYPLTGVSETEPADFTSLEVYIESGLETHTEDAIKKIGRHGGYIDTLESPTLAPPWRIEYEGRNITTTIGGHHMTTYTSGYGGWIDPPDTHYPLHPPDYPWDEFYTEDAAFRYYGELHGHWLGRSYLPRLETLSPTAQTTMKEEIESYIERGIQGLNIIDPFEHEFNINLAEEPVADVRFGEMHTSVVLTYPINVTHLGTGTRKKLEEFQIELPIPFKNFYSFIEDSVREDLRDLNFNLRDAGDYGSLGSHTGGYSINVIENISDEYYMDLIEFTFNYAEYEEPYTFFMVRDNRLPAMYDLEDINIGEIDSEYLSNLTHEIDEPKAVDPDGRSEEDLIFTYEKIADCPDEFSLLDEDTGEFEIECDSDGVYDCDIRIDVTDHPDREINDYEEVTIEYEC